jgi:TonB-linked SusC/RagA family outer membrane protein
MKRNLLLMIAFLFMGIGIAAAQSLTVTGTVVSESDGQPVVGAYVLVNGTTLGTITNDKGEFGIKNVPADAKEIIVTFLGFSTASAPVQAEPIKVIMKEDMNYLEETIVVAFGTSTKESFTGSATVISSDAIAQTQSSDVTRALEGRVAGVQMTTSSGTLGSSPTIRIRGFTSINAGNDPLYIVDGVPFSGDINNINPSDIESMTVLKDAASNALYGARGANGVIMITTKKAKAGEAVVTVDAKWGMNSKALQEYDVITDPAQYYEAHYLALRNYYTGAQGLGATAAHIKANNVVAGAIADGGLGYQVYTVPEGQAFIGTNGKVNPAATLGRLVTGPDGTEYWVAPDNWIDETYKQTLRQEYNVSVSGKSGNGSYLASFGYLNNKGIVTGNDMYRYTARLKADYQAKKWLKVGANFNYTNFNWNNGNANEGSSGSTANVFAFASSVAPIYPVYLRDKDKNIMIDSRGYKIHDYGDGANAGLVRPYLQNANPLQEITLNKNNSEGNALSVTGFAEFEFFEGFKFTFNVGTGLDETRSTSTKNPFYGQFVPNGGIVSKSHSRTHYINLQQLLTYQKTFAGKHNVSLLAGHESYKEYGYGLSASRSKMFSIDNNELSGAVVDGESSSSSKSMYNNEGYLARAQYDYANRVFVNLSYRRDASSRFHPDHRWGNFWSVGAAWLINSEPWFNAPWVNMLKVKASYGSQGNDQIGNYRYTDTYSVENLEGQIATTFVSKGNENITWETNENFNAGVEFGFLGNRITGSLEYFSRKTSDMLFFFNVATSSGYSGYYDNIGDMRNSGVEIDLNVNIFNNKNFTWDVYANATHYKNKVLFLPEKNKRQTHEGYEGYETGNKFIAEGLPLNTFFMPKYAGVDKNTGEALWFKDKLDENGEVIGRETTNVYDEATDYICDDPTPLFYGGFGTALSFYGFDVSANFTYSVGGLTYDSGYAGYMSNPTSGGGDNYHKDIFNAWTPENTDSNIPRWQYGDLYPASTSDRFLVPASYLNFQNAQIGYTLPSRITQKFKVSKLRVYASCDNIIYWSYRKGLDPRVSFSGSSNVAVNSPVRTLSGGINITF